MCNLRARYYSPATGTFNQRDTFMGYNEDPQSLHKYAYCGQDPINATDPSGFSPLANIVLAIGIISLVFSLYNFAKHPSLANFGWVVLDVATLPAAWAKVAKIGGGVEAILNLFKIVKGGLKASELAAKAWLFTRGITTVYKGEKFLEGFKFAGKAVDWIAESVQTGKWVLVEAKSVLGPDELIAAVGDVIGRLKPGELGKFSNTIAKLEAVDRMAGMAFKGVEELVITCKSVAKDKLGDFAIDAATGVLSYKGSKVSIEGIPVVVKEITYFF